MIVLFFLSLYLIIALASFDVHDPGWSSLGSGRSIHNLGGRAGAWSADVLMSLFGYLSYLFPIHYLLVKGQRLVTAFHLVRAR